MKLYEAGWNAADSALAGLIAFGVVVVLWTISNTFKNFVPPGRGDDEDSDG